MGASNRRLLPEYKKYVIGTAGVDPTQLPSNEPVYKNLKVAWLGSQDGSIPVPAGEPIGCRMFDHLSSLFEDCDHHLYDIANEVSWDAK